MKKKLLLTLMAIFIIAFSFFTMNRYKDFDESFNYNLNNMDQIFIKEKFNDKSTTVKVNKSAFDELIQLISTSKYRKVLDYKVESLTTRYEIKLNNNLEEIYFIVDENGIVFQSEDKSLKRYVIRKEQLRKILEYLETIIDNNDTQIGHVTKMDYKYIHDNLAKDISIIELLKRVNIDFENIIIRRVNVSLSGDGYISAMNISFFSQNQRDEFVIAYNKDSNILKINEFNSQITDPLKETKNNIILKALDYLLKEENTLKDYRSKRLINLYEPYETTLNYGSEEIFYNGKMTKDKETVGIIYSIIDMYSSSESVSKYYIFDDRLD